MRKLIGFLTFHFPKAFQTPLVLFAALVLANCAPKSLEFTSAPNGITGKFEAPTGTLSVSKISSFFISPSSYVENIFSKTVNASACDVSDYQVKMYSLDASGNKEDTAFATGKITSLEGDYKVTSGSKNIKEINASSNISYVVDIVGCDQQLIYSRPVTANANQDVNSTTSLMSSVLELDSASRMKLKNAKPAELQAFITELTAKPELRAKNFKIA